jgi:ATP-dependent Zn protease
MTFTDGASLFAWDAITRLGLDFEFGPVSLVALSNAGAATSGWLFDQAQKRLQEVLKEGLQRTEKLMAENWVKVEAVAQVLFEKKKLTEDDLITIMGNVRGEGAAETKS